VDEPRDVDRKIDLDFFFGFEDFLTQSVSVVFDCCELLVEQGPLLDVLIEVSHDIVF